MVVVTVQSGEVCEWWQYVSGICGGMYACC